ncbi:Serine carboxypeptidase-like 7, putative [Theobroma cacao]|uniref:Serine carboxypeptidase-like 7, putative n=1 Tax=Theobroma cacao TaxID=3641 RepID=A0A061FFN7_THECC|nr:Serine carboxypeptidase-like 7, putative [Theobroma cacao]
MIGGHGCYKAKLQGYTRTHSNRMTFATIKGGGHTAEYTPKECFAMFKSQSHFQYVVNLSIKIIQANPRQNLAEANSPVCSQPRTSHSLVKFLPGFEGPLPFELETGYMDVEESDDVQLFYYFVESERNPGEDPLLLWLTGGPGCSGLSGLVYEIGNGADLYELYDVIYLSSFKSLLQVSRVSSFSNWAKLPCHQKEKALKRFSIKQSVDFVFQSLKRSCRGEYQNINPSNVECQKDLQYYTKTYSVLLSSYWANDGNVQKAIHIRKGSIGQWKRCDFGLPYTADLPSSFLYHVNLSTRGYRALVYSGDHDMLVPFLGTEAWIKSLNYPIVDDWRPWMVQDQVAGYTRTYSNQMTYASIKRGGHTAPEYKPAECFAMFKRWISREPL